MWIPRFSHFVAFLCLLISVGLSSLPAAGADDHSPQSQESLPKMLSIAWERGPNLPQGFQDSDGGIVGHTLITACGFCQGAEAWKNAKELGDLKPGCYPRGFLKKVWGLDLDDTRRGWASLPDFPGEGRQENFAIVVDDQLYCWGGFNYTKPFCYADGYRLSNRAGVWKWEPLPALPSPVGGTGICAIGSTIYVCGGADYDETKFYTATDRSGKITRLGSRFLALDTKNLAAGWKRLPQCPGTPRWVAAMGAVRGQIYCIGGATGDLPNIGYCTVVDNWKFDPKQNQWSQLRDLPVSTGNFPSGSIVYNDRYLLLIGGAQYAKVAKLDGTIVDKYGVASRFEGKGDYFNDVFVYDTKTNLFGRADSLPLNNNLQMAVVRGNRLFLIGGETGGATIDGEVYGHHPDLCLIGTIREN
jgi:N-acetylneuraminic acid mutarotase